MIAPSQVINFGNALDSAARFVEAEDAFNLALNLAPSDAAVYTSLAHTAKSQGAPWIASECLRVRLSAPECV